MSKMSEKNRVNENGISLLEIMIAVTILALALLAMGQGISTSLKTTEDLQDYVVIIAACEQVLQETVARPFADLEAYNPPATPSETSNIVTFSVPNVTGTGAVRLSMIKSDATTGSKLISIRVFFPNTGTPIGELKTYRAKIID